MSHGWKLPRKKRKKIRNRFRKTKGNPLLVIQSRIRIEPELLHVGFPRKPWQALTLGDPCIYCGNPSSSWDHIDAIDRGGSTASTSNLARACQDCNKRKSGRTLLRFLVDEARRRKGLKKIKNRS